MGWSRTATFHEQLAAIVAAGLPLTQALQLAGDAAGVVLSFWSSYHPTLARAVSDS